MRARLTSSHFVGRLAELAELELALRDAGAGQPTVVLMGGQSGVGKTRLVNEFEQLAGEGDPPPLVLHGEAVEQQDAELPYAPLLGALRPVARVGHPAIEALSTGSRVQLATLLPGLELPTVEADRHDPAAQLRLFEAVLELLELLSEDQPLLLTLEDVHCADRSTRAFIAFLARSLRQERVMLLLTYRTDELHRRHPLRPLLADLDRLERCRRLELAPFDRRELAEALGDILDANPSAELVQRLFTRSEGNPLYTEELLAAGLDGRGAAPQTLRDAFLLRIERLSEEAQRAARVISVARRLDQATIAELSGIPSAQLTAALREAVAEQVLMARDDGLLQFRHALLREAVYEDLLPGERGELHLSLARLLEARPATGEGGAADQAAMVAIHYAAAGDQPAALRASVQAALAARQVHAYGEAAEHAERALELWPRVPAAERSVDLDHVDLLMLAASTRSISDNRGRSEVLLQTALAELDPDTDPRRYASVLGRLARLQWNLNRGDQGRQTAQRALALAGDEESQERATLLAWLARTQVLRGRYRDALEEGRAALQAAVAVGDRHTEIEVLNTLGMTQIALGHVEEGVASLRRAIEIAREVDDLDGLGHAYSNLADLLGLRGRTAEALQYAWEGLSAVPRRMIRLRTWLELTVSELSLEAGHWDTAASHLGPEPSHLTGVPLIFRLLREADLALGLGEQDRAARCLDEAEPLIEQSTEPQWIGVLGALLAELRRRRGDLDGARQAAEHALDRIELCTEDVMRIARVTAAGARVEADAAQRARDLRESDEEAASVARARIHAQRLEALAQDGGPVEEAWSTVGAAELARAEGRAEPQLWAAAAERWASLGRPYPAAQCRFRQAEAHVERGQREEAAAAAGPALATAVRLGAGWLRGELQALGDRARLALEPAPSQAQADGQSAAQADLDRQPDPFGLTERERQVLALVAEGATNRQIGNALFMAEKTASVHVSRILSKLGVRSRTQAAAVAHRMHLGR